MECVLGWSGFILALPVGVPGPGHEDGEVE